jgi:hypothetical protein
MLLSVYKRISRGKENYRDFFKRNDVQDDDWIIIFPDHDKDVNHYGLLYIDVFYNWLEYFRKLTEKNVIVSVPTRGKIFIITGDSGVYESAGRFSKKITGVELWAENDIENILTYYVVYRPDQIIIISLDRPNGRKCSHLCGKNNIAIKQLVGIGIYGISYDFFANIF